MKAGNLFLLALLWTSPAAAEVRELSQADLRLAVAEDRAIRTRTLIAGVEKFTGGDVLDIRAFARDAAVTYRILYRDKVGEIATLMVDGATGRAINPSSDEGQSVLNYTSTTPPANAQGGAANANAGQRAFASGHNNNNSGGNQSNSRGNAGENNAGGNGRGNGRND